MRVLLDECLPRKLKRELPGHEVRTVPEMGWATKKNGDLLRLAVGQFDVLLTVDRSLAYQQNITSMPISIISIQSRSNRLIDLSPSMPKVLEVLTTIQPSQIVRI
jgi:predicted nuclease of predicted toxin-antitoxin system